MGLEVALMFQLDCLLGVPSDVLTRTASSPPLGASSASWNAHMRTGRPAEKFAEGHAKSSADPDKRARD